MVIVMTTVWIPPTKAFKAGKMFLEIRLPILSFKD
jgi:hypothetical protein